MATSFEQIDATVAGNEEREIRSIREALAAGRYGLVEAQLHRAWLDEHERKQGAIERTAALKAANDAARSARTAAFWTAVAALASLLTIILTFAQFRQWR